MARFGERCKSKLPLKLWADAVALAGRWASARGLILDTGKGLFAAQYGENIENTRRYGTPRQCGTQWLSKVAKLYA